MKTELANKKQEILNWIFKSKDGTSWNEVSEMLNEFERICKDEAIAEHEKSKWKKYPDNLPEIGPTYLIQRKGNNIQITSSAYTYWSRLDIIAFRELPKPYQEERQSFGNPNGCHNCKHQDNDDVCKKCDDTWDKWEGGEK